MSLRHPLNVGSAVDELPEVTWDVMVGVPFRRGLDASAIARLQDDLWTELNATIQRVVGSAADPLAGAEVYAVRGRGADTPLFPMVAGDLRFTCAEDIVEAVERRCAGTGLAETMYDARGRAYVVSVDLHFRREVAHDGRRIAPLVTAGDTGPAREP